MYMTVKQAAEKWGDIGQESKGFMRRKGRFSVHIRKVGAWKIPYDATKPNGRKISKSREDLIMRNFTRYLLRADRSSKRFNLKRQQRQVEFLVYRQAISTCSLSYQEDNLKQERFECIDNFLRCIRKIRNLQAWNYRKINISFT